MTEKLPPNWTSAYLDGELSAEQRQEAERRLQDDATARQELDELREVSALLQSLPQQTPPDELAASVLQRCEREMLLSGGNIKPAVHDRSGTRSASALRNWSAVLGGLLTTATAVFLSLRVLTSPTGRIHQPANDARAVSQNDASTTSDSQNVVRRDADAENGFHQADRRDGNLAFKNNKENNSGGENRSEKMAGHAPQPQDKASAKSPLSAGNAARTKQAGANRAGEGFGEDKAPSVAQRHEALKPSNKQRDSDKQKSGSGGPSDAGHAVAKARRSFSTGYNRQKLRDAFRIGQVVPYLEVGENRTAVVEVTVVDVRKAVGRFEVLLAKESVLPVPDESKFGKRRDNKAGGKALPPLKSRDRLKRDSPRELVAVYVESTPEQLAAVMKELGKQTDSVHLALKPPISTDAVPLSEQDSVVLARNPDILRRRGRATLSDAVRYGRQQVPQIAGRSAGAASSRNGQRRSLHRPSQNLKTAKNADNTHNTKDADKTSDKKPVPSASAAKAKTQGERKRAKRRSVADASRGKTESGTGGSGQPENRAKGNQQRKALAADEHRHRAGAFQLRVRLAEPPPPGDNARQGAPSRDGQADGKAGAKHVRQRTARSFAGKKGRARPTVSPRAPLRVMFVFREHRKGTHEPAAQPRGQQPD